MPKKTNIPQQGESGSQTPSRRIWVGSATQLPEVHVTDQGREFSPLFGVWLEIHPTQPPAFAAFSVFDPESLQEPALVSALREALAKQPLPPDELVVATETDREILEKSQVASGFSVNVSPEASEIFGELMQEFIESLQQETGSYPLEAVAPIPGHEEITETDATEYFSSTLDFLKAKPWTGVSNEEAFEVTVNNAPPKFVSIMGEGQTQYGAVVFNSLDDLRSFAIPLSLGEEEAEEQQPSELPPNIGFSFDEPEECPRELAQLAGHYAPGWKRAKRLPVTHKFYDYQHFETPTCDEYRMLARIAEALAAMANSQRQLKAWPPAPGFTSEIVLGTEDAPRTVRVRYIGQD